MVVAGPRYVSSPSCTNTVVLDGIPVTIEMINIKSIVTCNMNRIQWNLYKGHLGTYNFCP